MATRGRSAGAGRRGVRAVAEDAGGAEPALFRAIAQRRRGSGDGARLRGICAAGGCCVGGGWGEGGVEVGMAGLRKSRTFEQGVRVAESGHAQKSE